MVVGSMQLLRLLVGQILAFYSEAEPGLRLGGLGLGVVELGHESRLVSTLSPGFSDV